MLLRMWCVALAIVTLNPFTAGAQEMPLAESERWTLPEEGARIEEGADPVLHLRGGAALLDGLVFGTGTIRFEMRLAAYPSFVGLRFRADDEGAEHVYFRQHRSGAWDAIQYQPILNRSSTWQTHVGEGYSGTAALPADTWIPVRLEVWPRSAELFVGESDEPALVMPRLERGGGSGTLAFTAGLRDDAPEDVITASFRRLAVDSRSRRARPMAPADASVDGMLIRWQVSRPFAVEQLPVSVLPDPQGEWQTVRAEPRGLVNLNRHFRRIPEAERTAVVARTVIESRQTRVVPLYLDFSDEVTVFLNGEPLFSGSNAWNGRYPYYLGVISAKVLPNAVWLGLREGENTLSVVVSERAFGWGFAARLEEADGVTVSW